MTICEALSHPGPPARGARPVTRPVIPGRSSDTRDLWKDHLMAAKPKPQKPADDAREQLRRALQTSMDTRQ
ncbi:hypothetical protein [Actinoplanes sp. NPDC051494]|uniref:hypothetical protein n=1 Tax=Actinoplanes sp. NPDC051494 TaxID=3363907 RepID=UPI00378B28F5